MVNRIKDLETELRDLEMQNYRLQKRIRVFEEHRASTERTRRESNEMLQELYCTVVQQFEKLQEENNRTKGQLRDLAKEVASNTECANNHPSVEDYERILQNYEAASENFMQILCQYYKEQDEEEDVSCNCPLSTQANDTTAHSCPTKLCNKVQEDSHSNATCKLNQSSRLNDTQIHTAIGGSHFGDLDEASNISTRGSTVPAATVYSGPSRDAQPMQCKLWPDTDRMIRELEHRDSLPLKCNNPHATECAAHDDPPSKDKEEGTCKLQESTKADQDNEESKPLKCHACKMPGAASNPCGCNARELNGKTCPFQSNETTKTAEACKKLLQRQDGFDEGSDEDDDDLLEDMMQADEEGRLQRSAAPEPSPTRLRGFNSSPGVVSYHKSTGRSEGTRSPCELRRRNSLPNRMGDKMGSVRRFVEDFFKTLWTPSKDDLRQPSVPEVKLRGSPCKKKTRR